MSWVDIATMPCGSVRLYLRSAIRLPGSRRAAAFGRDASWRDPFATLGGNAVPGRAALDGKHLPDHPWFNVDDLEHSQAGVAWPAQALFPALHGLL